MTPTLPWMLTILGRRGFDTDDQRSDQRSTEDRPQSAQRFTTRYRLFRQRLREFVKCIAHEMGLGFLGLWSSFSLSGARALQKRVQLARARSRATSSGSAS